eukprot:TRINITY_DN24054_c0_g1_i1.p1 TRINITY_DN24054_c0_g1~~TRINITY_DN24054_c0_g1_i1.p1  ORF type:complete len:321 (-),score=49.15 TRINITY_DN24054_c0_g1_i1:481-1443(-)
MLNQLCKMTSVHDKNVMLRDVAAPKAQECKAEVNSSVSGRKSAKSNVEEVKDWEKAKYKAEIISHPLYEQLLASHVACLHIATPVDRLQDIDAQLTQSENVISKYSVLKHCSPCNINAKELDEFMSQYILLLSAFKDKLHNHVKVHAMEAVMACMEIERSFRQLTGITVDEEASVTMSDDDDTDVGVNVDASSDGALDGHEDFGFGPLVPTGNERFLMEKVRQELKRDLKQGYRSKLSDVREEILRKRRAGKLPGDTTSRLKAWWQAHSKWPYPTEDEKARLVEETGLQLKQINNWFINQRKRNWNYSPSSGVSNSKRKR